MGPRRAGPTPGAPAESADRLPGWLAHPLRWQRAPLPRPAMVRGALAMGPLLAVALLTGNHQAGVLAGLGAMFAGINDRPGTRRLGLVQIGGPAAGGAVGLLLGMLLGQVPGWWALVPFFVVALLSGAVSVAGPVSSAAAVQLLVLAIVGGGMPLTLPGWARAGYFLAGAGWLLLLRLLPRTRPGAGGRHRDERLAVAAVFDALADALEAVGTPGAEAARRRLTAALDQADLALRLHRLLRLPVGPGAEAARLGRRFAAAAALCEASVALLWEGERLPPRSSAGPRRLAEAVRADAAPGPVPALAVGSAARSAFDDAVLRACLAFGSGGPDDGAAGSAAAPGAGPLRGLRRSVHPASAAGREYGLRVAVCVTASAAVALLLDADHGYWLPVTAAFLVKPDYGPLFSRTVNRLLGTLAAVLAATAVGPLTGWWPVAALVGCGVLIPFAARHFALQTAVVTVTVLCFVGLGGDTRAAGSRLADTAIACAIVLLVGSLPRLADTRTRVGHRSAHALRHTLRYVDHVLAEPFGERHAEERANLRRAAYHALSQARAAAEVTTAELATGADRDWLAVMTGAERIADAATACAVRLEHGRPRPSWPAARQVTEGLAALAEALDGGRAAVPVRALGVDCRTLGDIRTELNLIGSLLVAPAAARR
ncbi:FUSC family protein [Kitasatospora sp. NPDC057223]|uniref:FUSC family protein n=1 Tax=Kitasatospora sp. NPDC057223 TaxID=3346055 RepID=UPI00362C4FBF